MSRGPMGHDDDVKPTEPLQDVAYRYRFVDDRVRRSKFVMASILVVVIFIATAFAVNWYNDRVDCQLNVTVFVGTFPGTEPPEPLEGLELDLVLIKGGYPITGKEVDRITTHTNSNRTAHGVFVVNSVGEWSVWVDVLEGWYAGYGVDITESDDGETISFNMTVIFD